MSNYQEVLDSIIQAINNLITPQLVNLKYDKTFRAKVTKVIDAGRYEVQINEVTYPLSYDGILKVGDIIKVKAPLNNFSDIYIEAKGGSGGSGSATNYNDLINKPILNTSNSSSLDISSEEVIKDIISLHKISKTGKYSDLIGLPSLNFIPLSQKGETNGVATLDNNKKLIVSQLPVGSVIDEDYVHTDNNFTTSLLNKLNGIETGAEVNAISEIKVNDVLQPITGKIVSLTIPTKVSQLTNDSNFVTKSANNLENYYLKTETYTQAVINNLLDNKVNVGDVPIKTNQLQNTGADGINPYLSTINIKAGKNVSVSINGNNVEISSSGGGGGTSVEVIDNLDSDSSIDALSAKQGKVLNNKFLTQSISGDVEGGVSQLATGTEFDVTRRGCVAGQTSNSTTTLYYQFAQILISDPLVDMNISFKVSKNYGDNTTAVGILTAHVRTLEDGTFNNGELVWEYACEGIDVDNFIMCHLSSDNNCLVTLWLMNSEPNTLYSFNVIAEGNGTNRGQYWKLSDNKGEGVSSITSSYNQIISKVNNSLINMSDIQEDKTGTWIPVLSDNKVRYTLRKFSAGVSHSDYPNNQEYLATMGMLSNWNGAYNSSNSSNLQYCKDGKIQSKPIIAYRNPIGTTGTIALSVDAGAYEYMRVYYAFEGNEYCSNTFGGTAYIGGYYWLSSGSCASDDRYNYIHHCLLNVNGKTVTLSRNNAVGFDKEADTIYTPGGDNSIYIVKIELWN